jgi:hypothetical protein
MMEGRRLTLREQRILAQMETELARDRRLDARLRNLRPTRWLRFLALQRRLRAAELSLLVPTTLILVLASARTGGFGVIVACCALGIVTCALLAAAARGRAQRRRDVVQSGPRRLTPPEE